MTHSLLVAHTDREVLVWRCQGAACQRVVRLWACPATLRHALAKDGRKPGSLDAVWLTRDGFEQALAQSLVDPGELGKAVQAQHRLATRFAQVRLGFVPQVDLEGRATGHAIACLSLRNAARHALPNWVARTASVEVRRLDELHKAHRPTPYPIDPTVWRTWASV